MRSETQIQFHLILKSLIDSYFSCFRIYSRYLVALIVIQAESIAYREYSSRDECLLRRKIKAAQSVLIRSADIVSSSIPQSLEDYHTFIQVIAYSGYDISRRFSALLEVDDFYLRYLYIQCYRLFRDIIILIDSDEVKALLSSSGEEKSSDLDFSCL